VRWIGRPWLLAVILGMVLILATPLAAQASSVSTYAYDAATIPGTATTARATDPTIRSVETPAGDSGFVYDFYVNFVATNSGIGSVPTGTYNPANLGQQYGSATVVPRPDLGITGFRGSLNPADPFHGLNRAIERGVSPQTILETVRNPAAVLEQSSGRFLYLSEQGAVVLDDVGQVVTVWNRADFNAINESILSDALGVG
jgi:hypothetical protein